MQNTLKKIFNNDGLFLITTLMCVFVNAIDVLYASLSGFSTNLVQQYIWVILKCACVLTLYITYIKHAKNIMKCVMGALLMELVLDATGKIGSNTSSIGNACAWAYLVLMLALAINHLIINGDYYANNGKVYINQIIASLLIINCLIWTINDVILCTDSFDLYFLIIEWFCFASTIFTILYVESRLDVFRNERENAGWTKEKGYPEEYDRKKNYGK